jgi:hypothetical protein
LLQEAQGQLPQQREIGGPVPFLNATIVFSKTNIYCQ